MTFVILSNFLKCQQKMTKLSSFASFHRKLLEGSMIFYGQFFELLWLFLSFMYLNLSIFVSFLYIFAYSATNLVLTMARLLKLAGLSRWAEPRLKMYFHTTVDQKPKSEAWKLNAEILWSSKPLQISNGT